MNKSCFFELKRKIFHLTAIVFPVVYYFLSRKAMTIALMIITTLIVSIDLIKNYNHIINSLIGRYFAQILRDKELKNKLTAASYMLIGLLVTCILYQKTINIISWSVLVIADMFAALIGKRLGHYIYQYKKSILGSFTFFITSILTCITIKNYLFPDISIRYLILSCIITTIGEFFSKKIKVDDNLLIPIFFSTSFTLLSLC